MHDDHLDSDSDTPPGPERLFRGLRERPTDEMDSTALWRRIEGDLEPRASSWTARLSAALGLGTYQPAMAQLVAAGVVAVLLLGVVWFAPVIMAPGGAASQSVGTIAEAGAGQLVPLATDPETEAGVAETSQMWELEVRLVRGYSGAVPADALPSAAVGAGGADRLGDLRGQLAGLLPFPEVALVGEWSGSMDPVTGTTHARLSDAFELSFDTEAAATGLNLADVVLEGAGRPLVADALALTPGRAYLFGVQAEGEDTAAGSLVLAVRLVPAGGSPGEASAAPADSPGEQNPNTPRQQ